MSLAEARGVDGRTVVESRAPPSRRQGKPPSRSPAPGTTWQRHTTHGARQMRPATRGYTGIQYGDKERASGPSAIVTTHTSVTNGVPRHGQLPTHGHDACDGRSPGSRVNAFDPPSQGSPPSGSWISARRLQLREQRRNSTGFPFGPRIGDRHMAPSLAIPRVKRKRLPPIPKRLALQFATQSAGAPVGTRDSQASESGLPVQI